MKKLAKKPATVNEYFSFLERKERILLEEIRSIIKQEAAKAEELISYNMPAFKLDGMLVWYAACKDHIGFYPKPSAIKKFEVELSSYKTSKGAIQFPMEKPLPKTLIRKIVKFRLKENFDKVKQKSTI